MNVIDRTAYLFCLRWAFCSLALWAASTALFMNALDYGITLSWGTAKLAVDLSAFQATRVRLQFSAVPSSASSIWRMNSLRGRRQTLSNYVIEKG